MKTTKKENTVRRHQTLLAMILMIAVAVLGAGCADPKVEEDERSQVVTELKAIVDVSASTPKIILSWKPDDDAGYYAIYRSTDPDWKDFVLLTTQHTHSIYTDASAELKENTTYYYKVGVREKFYSEKTTKLSDAVEVEIPAFVITSSTSLGSLAAPRNFEVASVGVSSNGPIVTLTFTPVEGAGYYVIHRTTDPTWTDYIVITSSVSNTVYTDSTSLKSGQTYYYRVAARTSSLNSISEYSYTEVYLSLSGLGGLVATTVSDSAIKVNWDTFEGANKIRIYRSKNYAGMYTEIADADATLNEYVDTSLTPNTTYYYKVAIIDQNDRVGPISSNYVSAVTRPANKAVENLSAIANGLYISLSWDQVEGATNYYIYASLQENGPYVYLGAVNANAAGAFIVSTISYGSNAPLPLNKNTTYWFKVGTYYGGVTSQPVSATTGE